MNHLKEDVKNYMDKGYTYAQIAILFNFKNGKQLKSYNYRHWGLKCGAIILPKGNCLECNMELIGKYQTKFCSRRCSITYMYKEDISKSRKSQIYCNNCELSLQGKSGNKFCSRQCSVEYKRSISNKLIEEGSEMISSAVIKRYLIRKFGEKCMECGWNNRNLYSNTIPIELEHIDGNSSNNELNNVKLLCPNCHSLTPTYKNLNKGNGRFKRRERYIKGKSY
jgi:hypothetical protein